MMFKSKRQSLRINCKKREVDIRTAWNEGKAVLVNISTKGCAMINCNLQLDIEEIILISFSVKLKNNDIKIIEAQAKILRIYPQLAVIFTRIEPETESFILNFFISEYRNFKNDEGNI